MQQFLLLLTFALVTLTNAIPIPGQGQSAPLPHPNDILIGWKGIRTEAKAEQFALHPYTSGGGELGDVVYIADSTNLAHSFATASGYICAVYADPQQWHLMPKAWVSQAQIHTHARTMDHLLPGTVLFASHTAAGVSGDASPWQLGIRAAEVHRLGLTARCYHVSNIAVQPGHKLHYNAEASWNIQGKPERGH